jgi:hypothetical protein
MARGPLPARVLVAPERGENHPDGGTDRAREALNEPQSTGVLPHHVSRLVTEVFWGRIAAS